MDADAFGLLADRGINQALGPLRSRRGPGYGFPRGPRTKCNSAPAEAMTGASPQPNGGQAVWPEAIAGSDTIAKRWFRFSLRTLLLIAATARGRAKELV